MSEFVREVEFSPAYDQREEGYGIHGVDLRFILKGVGGKWVYLTIFTNWYLPESQKELDSFYHPEGAQMGYHSPVSMYEGQEPRHASCEHLDGKPCYSDCSFLRAEGLLEVLIREGSDGLWAALEEYHREVFDDS